MSNQHQPNPLIAGIGAATRSTLGTVALSTGTALIANMVMPEPVMDVAGTVKLSAIAGGALGSIVGLKRAYDTHQKNILHLKEAPDERIDHATEHYKGIGEHMIIEKPMTVV